MNKSEIHSLYCLISTHFNISYHSSWHNLRFIIQFRLKNKFPHNCSSGQNILVWSRTLSYSNFIIQKLIPWIYLFIFSRSNHCREEFFQYPLKLDYLEENEEEEKKIGWTLTWGISRIASKVHHHKTLICLHCNANKTNHIISKKIPW